LTAAFKETSAPSPELSRWLASPKIQRYSPALANQRFYQVLQFSSRVGYNLSVTPHGRHLVSLLVGTSLIHIRVKHVDRHNFHFTPESHATPPDYNYNPGPSLHYFFLS
jgi:hypothetical protein